MVCVYVRAARPPPCSCLPLVDTWWRQKKVQSLFIFCVCVLSRSRNISLLLLLFIVVARDYGGSIFDPISPIIFFPLRLSKPCPYQGTLLVSLKTWTSRVTLFRSSSWLGLTCMAIRISTKRKKKVPEVARYQQNVCGRHGPPPPPSLPPHSQSPFLSVPHVISPRE